MSVDYRGSVFPFPSPEIRSDNVEPIARCFGHTQWINDVTFSEDGTRIASASHDGTARLWDAATGDELLTLEHNTAVGNVAISPDGRQIVTNTRDGIFIWDAASDDDIAARQKGSEVSKVVKSRP